MNRIDMSSLKALSRSWLTQTTNEDSGNRQVGCQDLRRQRATDLPVMAEWIDHPPQAPPVRFLNGEDRARTCGIRHTKHLDRPKGRLVELDGARAVSN